MLRIFHNAGPTISCGTHWQQLDSNCPYRLQVPFLTQPRFHIPDQSSSSRWSSSCLRSVLLNKGKICLETTCFSWPSSLTDAPRFALKAPEFANYLKYTEHSPLFSHMPCLSRIRYAPLLTGQVQKKNTKLSKLIEEQIQINSLRPFLVRGRGSK